MVAHGQDKTVEHEQYNTIMADHWTQRQWLNVEKIRMAERGKNKGQIKIRCVAKHQVKAGVSGQEKKVEHEQNTTGEHGRKHNGCT